MEGLLPRKTGVALAGGGMCDEQAETGGPPHCVGQSCLVIFSRLHEPRELLCVWPAVAVQTFLRVLRGINSRSLAETPPVSTPASSPPVEMGFFKKI